MNMDKNEIKLREDENDGRSVFLYYDNMAGVYLAFGLSAYYTTMVTDPFMSYSEEMQMPYQKRSYWLVAMASTSNGWISRRI